MGGGSTGAKQRLTNGTRCMALEMELSVRACRAAALCGEAWQNEAKPEGGAVAKWFLGLLLPGTHKDKVWQYTGRITDIDKDNISLYTQTPGAVKPLGEGISRAELGPASLFEGCFS